MYKRENMKFSIIKIAVALCLAAIVLPSCASLKKIEVTSYQVESIVPEGMRSLHAALSVGVDNPSVQFTLQDTQVTVYRNGVTVGYCDVDPVTVRGRTSAKYHVSGIVNLAPNISLIQAMSFATHFDVKEYTLDIITKAKLKCGIGKKLTFKDMPLEELVN